MVGAAAVGVGFACAVAAPLAGLQPIPVLDRTPVRATGVVLVVVGIAVTLAAQQAMGASWRPDVDPDARTALVTSARTGRFLPGIGRLRAGADSA